MVVPVDVNVDVDVDTHANTHTLYKLNDAFHLPPINHLHVQYYIGRAAIILPCQYFSRSCNMAETLFKKPPAPRIPTA